MSHKQTKHQVRSLKKMFERRALREQTKDSRRERQLERALRPPAPPRRRDWSEAEAAEPSFEPIRRTTAPVLLPSSDGARRPAAAYSGTVIEVRSGDSLVMVEGRVVRAMLAPGLRASFDTRSAIAVGDRVALEAVGPGEARIVALMPRRSALIRGTYDPTRRDALAIGQVLAANIDQVIVVCSPKEPPFRPRLIDRYLVAASRDGLPAIICLNKTDLGIDDETDAWLRGYERLGVAVLRVSALTGDGIVGLRETIAGGVSLFSGHSGVGKSSLLNAIEAGLALKVGVVTQASAGQGKGRHTTSSARLIPLSMAETFVVDSPGIRAFGIKGIAREELASHFTDIAALAPGCAYHDCLHRGEPGCAVEAASRGDPFLSARLASYRSMLGEL